MSCAQWKYGFLILMSGLGNDWANAVLEADNICGISIKTYAFVVRIV
jgi:hypothetical protein